MLCSATVLSRDLLLRAHVCMRAARTSRCVFFGVSFSVVEWTFVLSYFVLFQHVGTAHTTHQHHSRPGLYPFRLLAISPLLTVV